MAWVPPASFLSGLNTELRDLPIQLSEIYPNPANDQVNFDYRIGMDVSEVKIIFHNVIGSVVGEHELDPFSNHLSVSVREFDSGIYFYTVVIDRQNALTRKFIVRH